MTDPTTGREMLPEPARFVFAGCTTSEHDCPVRYDGYGGTLLCSCICHTAGLNEWRQAAYRATRERDQARAAIARIEKWATTTEHGRAAAEVMLLLGLPAAGSPK